VAQVRERADVALAHPVRAQGLEDRRLDLLARPGHVDLDDLRRVQQPLHVLAQAEHRPVAVLAAVAADALEHAHAVVQRLGEDVDLRIVPGNQLPVEPDALGLLYGHYFFFLPNSREPAVSSPLPRRIWIKRSSRFAST